MRPKQLVIFQFLFICLLISITAGAQSVQKIYFNPKDKTIQKQSSYVDSIRFIPLEKIPGVDVDANSNIQLTKDHFLVVDYMSGNLLIYKKNGKFLKKIHYKAYGANLYPNYDTKTTNEIVFFSPNSKYNLTSKDKVKIELDWNNKKNLKYYKKYVIDLKDSSFLVRKVPPNKYDIINASPYFDDYYIQGKINTSPLYHDSLDYELKIFQSDQLVKAYFPYNRINEPRFQFREESVATEFVDNPFRTYVTRPYCDTIYKLTKDSLYPIYQLVLPLENSLPSRFSTIPFKNKTEKENFRSNNGWAFGQIYNFYETTRLAYLEVSFFRHSELLIYDKINNTAYKASTIKPDQSQYNLSLLSANNVVRYNNKFYKTEKAETLSAFLKQYPNANLPDNLSSFLNSNPGNNALIVVEFKLKD